MNYEFTILKDSKGFYLFVNGVLEGRYDSLRKLFSDLEFWVFVNEK